MRNLITAGLVAGLFALGAVQAGNERLSPEQLRSLEREAKAQAVFEPAEITVAATVSYSDTTVGGPSWTRPLASCAGASSLGPFTYHVQQFSVTVSGNYSVDSVQTGGWDGYIFVYGTSFDPAAPNANCLAANDDGPGGIGTSRIASVALTAGTNYFVVTTGFENGEEGPFTNTIDGPGDINLVGAGPSANLGIAKTAPDGVVNGGSYVYRLVASNAGPDDATGVTVTDPLPAGVSFVSSTCGATAAGGTVSWNIGNLANGASASCDLTVQRNATMCSVVSNTATISGNESDPVSANNSSTHSNQAGNLVADPSFEAGVGAGSPWAQASSSFGTPLCTTADCGTGSGSAGPRTGSWWAWFGGAAAGSNETASVQQSLNVPAGANTLEFGYRLGLCAAGAGASHFVRALIDGTEVWRRDASSAECGAATYSVASVDISAFATGASRTLRFESTTVDTTSNFNIDDISILPPPVCVDPPSADLALSQTLGAAGAVGLGSPVAIHLTASNNGPGAAASVAVTTTLPSQLSFTGSTCGATLSGSTVAWNIGNLANGASAACTLNTTINGTGGFTVSSVIASGTSDPVPGNNSASSSLAGVAASNRPAVVPTLDRYGLLVLVLAVLAIAGFSFSRRQG